jgi:3-oxoacyl-[acyl-carrier protein] reductase
MSEAVAPAARGKAVVTGANSGIGEAIARRLAADGAQVLLVARNAAELERVAAEIAGSGGRAAWCAVDLAEREAAGTVVAAALEAMGGIDMLVNCASLTHNADFFELTDDHWENAFAVKVFAAIRLCRLAWPALKRGRGSIVNIGGIGARTPSPFTAITAASSSALLAVTKLLAESGLADGVQVNAINPGLIRTPRIERTIGAGKSPEEVTAALEATTRRSGVVRVGLPEDVASLVAYIVSPAGELLQGAIIDLDGGATKGL